MYYIAAFWLWNILLKNKRAYVRWSVHSQGFLTFQELWKQQQRQSYEAQDNDDDVYDSSNNDYNLDDKDDDDDGLVTDNNIIN